MSVDFSLPTKIKEFDSKNESIDFVFLSLIGVFILFLILRDMIGFPVSKYVFIVIATVVFALGDLSKIVAFLAFLTPICLGVSYTFITFVAIIFVLLKGKPSDFGFSLIFPFTIIFIEVINSFLSVSDTVPEFLRSVVMIVLFALLFLDKNKKFDAKLSLYMYLLGYVVLVVFTIFWVGRTGSIQEYLFTGTTLKFGLVDKFEGNKIFAASFAMGSYSVMTIAISLLLLYIRGWRRFPLLFLVILSFVMGFVSTSRSFVFSSLVCVFLYVLFSAKSTKGAVKVVVITTILCLVAFLLVNTILSKAFVTFLEKMNMADFSNGRIELFKYYNAKFFSTLKTFLIGFGLQNYMVKCGSYWNAVHNAIQEVLLAWGIVGFFCVAGFFGAMYQNAVRGIAKEERRLIYSVPALVYLFYVQFNQLFSVRSYTIILLVTYCALALNEQLIREKQQE